MIFWLSRGLVGHFRAIIRVGLVDLLNSRHDRSMRSIITFELISDQPAGFRTLPFEEMAEEAFRCIPITVALD